MTEHRKVTPTLEPPHDWLCRQFEHEFCAECGGDAQHHTCMNFLGNWFARCDYPPAEDGSPHPIVAKFRKDYTAGRKG